MNYGFGSYRRTDIQTADRRKVIVLLYEGAIANLNKALACMQAGEFQQMSIFINKTLDIVKFLDNALDMSQGGEIAANLRNLYVFMRDTLMRANIDKDSESIDTVIGLFGTLLEGWRGVLDQPMEAPGADSRAEALSQSLDSVSLAADKTAEIVPASPAAAQTSEDRPLVSPPRPPHSGPGGPPIAPRKPAGGYGGYGKPASAPPESGKGTVARLSA
ncbi:MAG: Flagellar protein FliS [candidate division BRC1 bacterium ADurb.BinA364]|nr:MAG: Flagellar protein FliS [candidate division BRC1 bacterium ADurb.BinA364]